jgi:hypothetical protein
LNKPAPAIRLINAAGMAIEGRYFYLPATDLYTLDGRAKEYAAVAIGFLLELQGKVEVLIGTGGRKITVLFVGAAFANQLSFVHVPFFSTMDGPAIQVFAIEEALGLLSDGTNRSDQKEQVQEMFHNRQIYAGR